MSSQLSNGFPSEPPTVAAGVNGTSTDRIQIIDEDKNFTGNLAAQINNWSLGQVGFDYNVVAVFGSQSTGKSTLLNKLFGTTFDVMDESRRQQTTKGIWMCKGKEMNVMVMDVEGTDGRERGEDQDFERKAALFSLASSEVLIVNLWEHQVGLYQGANMGLLKTVFEVNLGLFGKKMPDGTRQRTLLLFVIRDFLGATPLQNLSNTLAADINKIWDSISKPEGLESSKLDDYFDLSFTGLPHKILVPDKFEDSVKELRKRFVDKDNADYIFKTEYHKRIPADGVAIYMEGVWEQVQSNKDLDLPTQQELLAQFRCDEIASVALEEFNMQARSQRKPVEAGRVVEGLGKLMSGWTSTALTRYDRDASRYHQGVYKRKRLDLLSTIDSFLTPLFLGQLKNLHKLSLGTFKRELADVLKGTGYDFGQVVQKAKALCEERFVAGASEAKGTNEDWSFQEALELLKEEIKVIADQCRTDETKKLINQTERSMKRQISEPTEVTLHRASSTMWDDVLSSFRKIQEKVEESYLVKAKSFNCTDDENAKAMAIIRWRSWHALRSKIEEQTADNVLLGKLRSHFEERFRYDANSVPRVWKPDDDIDGAFRAARDETLDFIPLYSKIAPRDTSLVPDFSQGPPEGVTDDDYESQDPLTVLSETKVLDLTNRFRRDADAFYVEAKRSTVSSIAQIPMWMYGVLVVLGWNEAMAVLFNPVYFMMLLFGLTSAYIIVQLGLVGPLFQVTRSVTNEIQRQATNKLREHFSQPVLNAPIMASNDHNRTMPKKEEDYDSIELEQIHGQHRVL